MKRFVVLAAVVCLFSASQVMAADAQRVNRFASEVTAAAAALQNANQGVNNQFSFAKKSINKLADDIRVEAAQIVINAARVNNAGVANVFLAGVERAEVDLRNLDAQIQTLDGQARAAKDKATQDLARQLRDLARNISRSLNRLENELD